MFDERKELERGEKNGGFEGSTIASEENGSVAISVRCTIDAAYFGQIL